MKTMIMNMNMVRLSLKDACAKTKEKSIEFTSGKKPDANDVKWSTSQAVKSLVVFTT